MVLCAIGVAYSQHAQYVCVDEPNGMLVRNTQHCSTYFYCLNGLPILTLCEPHLMYNIYTRKCELAANVDCFKCPEVGYYDVYAASNTCNHFVRCFNGKTEQLTCAPGLRYDRSINKCNLASEIDCPFDVWCPLNHDTPIFTRDRDDCAK